MTTSSSQDSAATPGPVGTYQIRVAGHLDDHWAGWLGCEALSRNDDASTTLTVSASDQAHLHGVLGRIRDIGARLVSLDLVQDRPAPTPSPTPTKDLT